MEQLSWRNWSHLTNQSKRRCSIWPQALAWAVLWTAISFTTSIQATFGKGPREEENPSPATPPEQKEGGSEELSKIFLVFGSFISITMITPFIIVRGIPIWRTIVILLNLVWRSRLFELSISSYYGPSWYYRYGFHWIYLFGDWFPSYDAWVIPPRCGRSRWVVRLICA